MTTTLAVVGGKGGVGKTTVAVNLAVELARRGTAVGLVDGDIGGPDAMRLLGATRRKAAASIDLWSSKGPKRIEPVVRHGVQVVSPQMMVAEDQPLLLAGSVLDLLLRQLLEPEWDPRPEYVVVDSAPGTGEVAQKLLTASGPAGAILVSGGTALSVLDNRKMSALLAQVDVPLWAVVENLRSLECPHCGGDVPLGVVAHDAAPGLQPGRPPVVTVEVPFDVDARLAEDTGVPAVAGEGADQFKTAMAALANHVVETAAR